MAANTTYLYLVRHGNKANPQNLTGGWTDLPLSDEGRRQAAAAGERLRQWAPFDVFISSPLSRAVDTAKIISHVIKQDFVCDDGLKEINNGDLADRTDEEWKALYPDLAALKWGAFTRVPGGEMEAEFAVRVAAFWNNLFAQNKGKKILLVGHAGSLHAILKYLVRFPVGSRNGLVFMHGDAAISRIQIDGDDEVYIEAINDRSHLAALQ